MNGNGGKLGDRGNAFLLRSPSEKSTDDANVRSKVQKKGLVWHLDALFMHASEVHIKSRRVKVGDLECHAI